MMLTDAEICDMVSLGAAAGRRVVLVPRASGHLGHRRRRRRRPGAPVPRAGPRPGGILPGGRSPAASLGVRNVLVADEGVLWALNEQRVAGDLPADMRFKISVLIGPVNPVSFRWIAALGADSINVHSDLTVAQLAEIRAASSAALDMYVESPDDIGGFVRLYEAAGSSRRRSDLPQVRASQRTRHLPFRRAPPRRRSRDGTRTRTGALDSPSTSSNAAAALRCPCRRWRSVAACA